MTKICDICGEMIKGGDRVVVGYVSVFVDLPSLSSWAVEKSSEFISLAHAKCEGLED